MSTQSIHASTVNSFYLAFYGRPADPAGLAFWATQLANNDGNLSAITQAFATSEEAQVRFGTNTVEQRIGEIYQALFNRAPDTAGLAYWKNVVEQGHASVADVAVAIMNGAQGIDQSLTALRQTAVDAFTAMVEASGSQYSGYASVEAARILVRAITVDTATGDVDALVKAAVSFADTATKTPQVVDAIATGSTLLALFDTARGKGDPVGLAQTLADTAKAAAGNPVTLESLLRGGGMDQVLKVMPASASLQDVVAALAAGGLPAAIEVVYPTLPVVTAPAPTFSLKLAFAHVDQGGLDVKDDNVTNQGEADVTFTYTGRDLRDSQHFEYSLDGIHWTDKNIDVDPLTNTVVLKQVLLNNQLQQITSFGNENVISIMAPLPVNQIINLSLRAVDANGATTTPVTQTLVYDGYVAAPSVALAHDSYHGNGKLGSDHDMLTNKGGLVVDFVEPGATIDYLVEERVLPSFTINGIGPVVQPKWTATPVYHEGVNVVTVRITDVAGNQNERQVTFTLDTEAPDTPDIALRNAPVNGTVSSGVIDITGLDQNTATAWEYSTDKGRSWNFGGRNNGNGDGTLTLSEIGAHNVLVRQYDAAGNIGLQTAALEFTLEAEVHTLAVYSGDKGIEIESSVAGDIFLETANGLVGVTSNANGGGAIDGWVILGAQDKIASGTFVIETAQGVLVKDLDERTYTLGTATTDYIEGADNVWGFGGNDTLFGANGDDRLFGGDGEDFLQGDNGHDYLHGGAGNDTIYGGADGDQIVVSEGLDTLYYLSPTESNLSTYIPNSQSASSIDIVYVDPYASVLFDFNNDVANVRISGTQIVGSFSGDELYAALTAGYNAAKVTSYDAVIFTIDHFQLLVVNDGNAVIDDQDIVIAIIGTGTGTFTTDLAGNVLYGAVD